MAAPLSQPGDAASVVSVVRKVDSAEAMEALGGELARATREGAVYFLHGDLGAGKTTLVRGFIRALGHPGRVKSPTYTLVETYHLGKRDVYHFDLYRLADPDELEWFGVRDYFAASSLCLVEWAERAGQVLGEPDIHANIVYLEQGRKVAFVPDSLRGREVLQRLHR